MSKVPPPPINENLTFGIDLGIASCGWAVIERKGRETPKILGSGSWCFNTPEEDKTRTPLNQNRREKRLLRRVIRRRRQRMQKIRSLFDESGLLQFLNGKKNLSIEIF
ncbi:crossover junction endodeoxyribonuclease RuvC [Acetobacteraceae bacterium]|nr:crossover junction endodeoxyribonuclease RuvC [Acetobacteraceae bacterium]